MQPDRSHGRGPGPFAGAGEVAIALLHDGAALGNAAALGWDGVTIGEARRALQRLH